MDELLGAHLAADQREAIANGELAVKPPQCSQNECWQYADVWVGIEHPEHEPYEIPRCNKHKDAVPHTSLGARPIEGGSNED